MNERPPHPSPRRLLAGLILPLAGYTLIRALLGSTTGALAITEALSAAWLVATALRRRRLDPIALLAMTAVAIEFAAYALTGGDPLALELRRAAVTGPLGLAALTSIALGRPLLLLFVRRIAKLNPDRRAAIEARLAEPDRRRALTILTAIIGLTLALDGATQVAVALTVPTGSFVADSTAARIVVLGAGLAVGAWYFRYQKEQRERHRRAEPGRASNRR